MFVDALLHPVIYYLFFFFVLVYGAHRDLHVLTHSFPTLRSSDLGVVVTRRRIGHPWQEFSWHATEAIPGAPKVAEWRLLRQAEAETAYLAATLQIGRAHV